jgi:hypothetical protein
MRLNVWMDLRVSLPLLTNHQLTNNCIPGTIITYCILITNTGDSYLSGLQIEISTLDYDLAVQGVVGPGESRSVAYTLPIEATIVATAKATANPTLGKDEGRVSKLNLTNNNTVTEDGTRIPSATTVMSSDPANQELIPYKPAISIDNLVYIGDGGSDGCASARDFVEGPVSFHVDDQHEVTNNIFDAVW